jgi:thiol-disulfide isomerase/thioredoxin
VETQHDDFEPVVDRGPTAIVHDQSLLITEARLALDVGLTRRFGFTLMAPIRMVNTSIRYVDMAGTEVQLVTPGIHHRNETVVGLADPLALFSYTRAQKGWQLTVRTGSTLPIGRTEDDPFALGDMGLAHQHIQMGTGTVNPVGVVELSRAWGPWRAGGFALTQQVVYTNSKGYRAGDRYAGGLLVRRAMSKRWSLRGEANVQSETAEKWQGIVHTDDGNRGRFDVILGAGSTFAVAPKMSLDLAVKVPVVTYAVGGQLDMPVIFEVGASWTIGGPAKKPAAHADDHDDDHDHDHGDAHGDDDHDHGDDHAHVGVPVHGHGHDPGDADVDVDAHDHEASEPVGHADGDGNGSTAPSNTPPPRPAPKADVADYGKPGEARDLVPVRGKLTVFDFWATWCKPCKQLEPELVALARKYPGIVAVRRVDVVDWDSEAVAKHLSPKGFDLPHLKIFDASGKLVLERSSNAGGLSALIDDVKALVEAAAKKRAK